MTCIRQAGRQCSGDGYVRYQYGKIEVRRFDDRVMSSVEKSCVSDVSFLFLRPPHSFSTSQ